MRGAAQLATYIAITLVVAGLALIAVAWNGAAGLDRVQGQFPYLLSGGLSGLGLVVSGMGVLLVQTLRGITAERARQMSEVNESMARLAVLLQPRVAQRPRPEEPTGPLPTATPAPEHEHFDEPELQWPEPQWDVEDDDTDEDTLLRADTREMVVAGRSSFHRPQCRLVSTRGDLQQRTQQEAEAAGLSPCRICKP